MHYLHQLRLLLLLLYDVGIVVERLVKLQLLHLFTVLDLLVFRNAVLSQLLGEKVVVSELRLFLISRLGSGEFCPRVLCWPLQERGALDEWLHLIESVTKLRPSRILARGTKATLLTLLQTLVIETLGPIVRCHGVGAGSRLDGAWLAGPFDVSVTSRGESHDRRVLLEGEPYVCDVRALL